MHFEVLIEDLSGKTMLDILLPKIISEGDTYNIEHYKGVGHIPKGLKPKTDANKRILLDQLPRLLRGYGKKYTNYDAIVIVVCDLDDKNKNDFLVELNGVLASCNPAPVTHFCLAIEEGEAWLFGDTSAIKRAYPKAKTTIFSKYQQDSICGTWELLADAIHQGGYQALATKSYFEIGKVKIEWAEKICPHMDINKNQSPSFNFLKNVVQSFG